MEVLAEVNLVMILFTRLEVSVSFLKKAKTNSSSEMTPSLSESISDISFAEIYQILCCKSKIYIYFFYFFRCILLLSMRLRYKVEEMIDYCVEFLRRDEPILVSVKNSI